MSGNKALNIFNEAPNRKFTFRESAGGASYIEQFQKPVTIAIFPASKRLSVSHVFTIKSRLLLSPN